MKKLLFLFATIISTSCVMASAVDWAIRFSESSEMASTWNGAQVYSYLMLTPDADSTAMDPIAFMETWSEDFSSTTTEIKGDAFILGANNKFTGSVTGWEEGGRNGPWAGYLIVVLVNENGDVMYSFAGNATAEGEGTLIARDDLSAWGSAQEVVFDENSNWTILNGDDPNVPEPTALALLALGVAGVALRRRVA